MRGPLWRPGCVYVWGSRGTVGGLVLPFAAGARWVCLDLPSLGVAQREARTSPCPVCGTASVVRGMGCCCHHQPPRGPGSVWARCWWTPSTHLGSSARALGHWVSPRPVCSGPERSPDFLARPASGAPYCHSASSCLPRVGTQSFSQPSAAGQSPAVWLAHVTGQVGAMCSSRGLQRWSLQHCWLGRCLWTRRHEGQVSGADVELGPVEDRGHCQVCVGSLESPSCPGHLYGDAQVFPRICVLRKERPVVSAEGGGAGGPSVCLCPGSLSFCLP